MVAIFLAMIVLTIFILLLALAGKRVVNTEREERDEMIKLVYHYAVAFITLIMVIGGGVFAFMSVADYVAPNAYIETFEEYKDMRVNQPKYEYDTKQKVEITEEELRKQYDAMVHQRIENSKQRAKNGLIKSLGWIIIPLPVYIFFQRRINREKKVK
ncbi:hypothetical protein [Bacillus sp. Marseille-P3661]|uniref:hypothetical protein n=1 Tax=Bacillus sp. Marseille-P3661 TaxID=1936234 RepID=UPI000C816F5D|nr:hypothetical protein [Bacillus sp. Marseille-P3661]